MIQKKYLDIKIDKTEKSFFVVGNSSETKAGYLIYVSIYNPNDYPVCVEVISSYMINRAGMQAARNYYYTGYHFSNGILYGHAKRILGEIYLCDSIGEMETGTRYVISINDTDNRVLYSHSFELESIIRSESSAAFNWAISQKNIYDQELFNSFLKSKIDRIESLEERFGIKIENVSLSNSFEIDKIKTSSVMFEVFGVDDEKFPEDLFLNVVVYDTSGTIIGRHYSLLKKKAFIGYQMFSIEMYDMHGKRVEEIGRIRIYPSGSVNY